MTGSPEHDMRADAIIRTLNLNSGDRFRSGMFLGEFGPDSADTLGSLLEEVGLRPYKSGKSAKHRAEQEAPIVNYTRPGS